MESASATRSLPWVFHWIMLKRVFLEELGQPFLVFWFQQIFDAVSNNLV